MSSLKNQDPLEHAHAGIQSCNLAVESLHKCIQSGKIVPVVLASSLFSRFILHSLGKAAFSWFSRPADELDEARSRKGAAGTWVGLWGLGLRASMPGSKALGQEV